ncbi:MAG: SLC13 family permease, partial [Pseudomonadota bacterium]
MGEFFAAGTDIAMVATLVVIAVSTALYATERYSIEAISLGVIASYLIIFVALGLPAEDTALGAGDLLAGFANPGLITIVALLVVGQGLFHTDALERPAQIIIKAVSGGGALSLIAIFCAIAALSAFLNNTPVVVMFIPLISTLSAAMGFSVARVMMPLSFVTILGGMTTLIGSSTNLLAANVARQSGAVDLSFFSFTPVAVMMALVALPYVLGVVPLLLRNRTTMAEAIQGASGKQFIAEIPIRTGHPLVGARATAGLFP